MGSIILSQCGNERIMAIQKTAFKRMGGDVMMTHFLSSLLLGAFITMIIAPNFGLIEVRSDSSCATLESNDFTPCPDSSDEGPCSADCPCLCCPGYTSYLFVRSNEHPIIPLAKPHNFIFSDSTPPNGVARQVFRPPQV